MGESENELAAEVRERLVAMRNDFDAGAKEIVRMLGREPVVQHLREEIAEETRTFMLGEMHATVVTEMNRCKEALEHWETTERTPLQDDEQFMWALRRMFTAIGDYYASLIR